MTERCINCGRDENKAVLTNHHLKPKIKGGASLDDNKAILCLDCHQFLNTQFTENEQRDLLPTIEAIQTNQRMRSFAKFARKQNKRVKQKDSKERHRKRRK